MTASLERGERRELITPQYDNMLRCIRCGLCLSVCPTYLQTFDESESPRGRIAVARAFAEGHLDFSADLWAHQESCLLCEACTAICPAGVHMEEIGVALRAAVKPEVRRSVAQSTVRKLVFDLLFADMGSFRRAAGLAKLYRSTGLDNLARGSGLLQRLGLARVEALLPRIEDKFLVPAGQMAVQASQSRQLS